MPFTFLMLLLSVYTMLSYQTSGPVGSSNGVMTYTVILIVTDGAGQTSTFNMAVSVQ